MITSMTVSHIETDSEHTLTLREHSVNCISCDEKRVIPEIVWGDPFLEILFRLYLFEEMRTLPCHSTEADATGEYHNTTTTDVNLTGVVGNQHYKSKSNAVEQMSWLNKNRNS